jgi:D-beta-D-heptose 7-phosphate kinase/D-beta-D-heptose 1-phosphate adenosyltransferase
MVNGKFVFRHDADKIVSREKSAIYLQETMDFLRTAEIDAILISDYDKGFLTPDCIRKVIEFGNERGIPVVADAKREPTLYRGVILKYNLDYFCKFAADDGNWDFNGDTVCTFGQSDPTVNGDTPKWFYRNSKGELPDQNTPTVNCINHVGAGDCFAAHLTLALAHGLSLEDAACIAHSAGRVYVQHPHNRPPHPFEIRKDIDPVRGKMLEKSDLLAMWNSVAGRIVFAPGVFRLVHSAHSEMLRWAKSQGDILVVGLNDDESAARLRNGEFVLPLSERAELLGSMDCVDWIIPFSESDPVEVMKLLKPDCMVKGPEYNGCAVPGADLCEVRFAPKSSTPERSVTGLVREIVGASK